ncbi:MAG: hypothetical protein WC761_00250 [Candidatus Paceibacterota bacterium]
MEREPKPGQIWEVRGTVPTNKVLSISENEIVVAWKRRFYALLEEPATFLILKVWNYSEVYADQLNAVDRIPLDTSSSPTRCKIIVLCGEDILGISYSDWHYRTMHPGPEFRLKLSENIANEKE